MSGLLNWAIAGEDTERDVTEGIGSNDIIGDVLKKYPATKEVFRKHYGAAR